jgi:LysM repeat protein
LLRRLWPIGLLILTLLTSCGKGSPAGPAVPKQPSDPRTAATATIPSALPSPIPAVVVAAATGGPAGAPSTVAGASATSGPNSYVVKSGDTLGAIAAKLGVSLADLQSANPDIQAADLHIGQQLNVPAAQAAAPQSSATPAINAAATPAPSASTIATSGILPTRTPAAVAATPRSAATSSITGPQTYTVKSGDTGCKIASAHQVSLQELAEANGTSISGLASLKVGQQLKIPAATGSPPGC